jgi:hypothetical protein
VTIEPRPPAAPHAPRLLLAGYLASFILASAAAYLAVHDAADRTRWIIDLALLGAVFASFALALARHGAARDPRAAQRVALVSIAFAGLVVAVASFALAPPSQAGPRALGVGTAGAALLATHRLEPARFRGAAGAFVWVGPAALLAMALIDGTAALVRMTMP